MAVKGNIILVALKKRDTGWIFSVFRTPYTCKGACIGISFLFILKKNTPAKDNIEYLYNLTISPVINILPHLLYLSIYKYTH